MKGFETQHELMIFFSTNIIPQSEAELLTKSILKAKKKN